MEIVHPITSAKPRAFDAEPKRQGGQLAARCECGHYCNHNHKAPKQAWICVARHAIEVQKLEQTPKEVLADWGMAQDGF